MKKLLMAALNALLSVAVFQSFAALADSRCPKSSACPGADANCTRNVEDTYHICQSGGISLSTGCCEWTKIIYSYTSKPGHNCNLPICGQWSNDPPVDGSFTVGKHCDPNDGQIHQGSCVL